LLETQKTGEALTAALEALNKELDKKEYQSTLYPEISRPIDHLYAASNQLLHHHQLSMSHLRELTASLGLLQIEVPLSISKEEEEFLKKLVILQGVKTILWNKLQRLQDEISPINEAATRSGKAQPLGEFPSYPLTNAVHYGQHEQIGTKKLQGIIRSVNSHGRQVLPTIDTHNSLVEDLSCLPRPSWIPENRMPQKLARVTNIRIDPDAPFWDEMAIGNTWVEMWGTDLETAPGYVRDPAVRRGIKTMLLEDRIAEERARIITEWYNCRAVLEGQMVAICETLLLYLAGELLSVIIICCDV
jgi:hypothetical protein